MYHEQIKQLRSFDQTINTIVPNFYGYYQEKNVEDINRVILTIGINSMEHGLWWTQGISTDPVYEIRQDSNEIILLNGIECKIKDLWIYRCSMLEWQYIIIHTQAMPSFGFPHNNERNKEYAGYFHGQYVTSGEFEDGYTIVDGEDVELVGSELRMRFLYDEFFIIAPKASVYLAFLESDNLISLVLHSLKVNGKISPMLLEPLENLDSES